MNTAINTKAACPLSQAHRDAMAYLQDLASTISLQGTYAVSVEYVGHTHEFSAHVLRFSEITKGNFRAEKTLRTLLPRHISWAGDNALEELQTMARELETLLVIAEGGAS